MAVVQISRIQVRRGKKGVDNFHNLLQVNLDGQLIVKNFM